MNFNWNPQTIKWYQEANTYSQFFKNIADLIAPQLEGCSSLCDIGCGLGLIDLELSPKLNQITCIDINDFALSSLKATIALREITNIEPRLMDCDDISGHWDVIYTSFFGSRNPEKFLPFCKKQISVVGKKELHNPTLKKYQSFHKNTYDEVAATLDEKGIPFTLTEVSLEFGQPLTSVEDGKKFIKNNYPKISDKDLNCFLSQNLVETGEGDYPFYIPKRKSLGIFEVKGACR
ncbi:methyltransferase [Acetobacterium carbinolicum]|uniref:methyltransferase n=1 Tax=Acetobacterium carbinolicum TaxID=52690 RepID=UPI0039C9F57B